MSRLAHLLVCTALLWLPKAAEAQQVHRCVGPDGSSVYSDQPCQSLGAVARQAPRRPAAVGVHGFTTGTGTVAPGCARSLDGLLMGVRGALEARDVNRLATHYHWAGTSARGGRHLMDELEAIARRPLVAIDYVYAQPPAAQSEALDFGPDTSAPAGGPGEMPDAPPPRLPQALRIEQASGPSDAGAVRTDFELRRHAGCWWVEL